MSRKELAMDNFQHAQDLVSYGLCALPAANKQPIGKWKGNQVVLPDVRQGKNSYLKSPQLFIVCGAVSGNTEVIDVDEKNDPEKKIFGRFKYLVQTNHPNLWDCLVIEKTPSGGYHIFYRCSVIQGSQKLAKRQDDETLIETRGQGGGIICAPSPGYVLLKGSFANIPTITPDERAYLLSAARSLTQKVEEPRQATEAKSGYAGITPLDDYNQRGPVIELLESYGWTVSSITGDAFYLKRPNGGSHEHHATFGYIPNTFFCFSTSTEFESEKPYSRCAVYALLKHDGDFKVAAKQLYADGYGDRGTKQKESAEKSANQDTRSTPGTDTTNSASQQEELDLDALLLEAEIDIDVELPPPPTCMSFQENGYSIPITTLGNFSMLIGKAKSRKTFFVLTMLAAWIRNGLVLSKFKGFLPENQTTVLHFDTEQGKYHAQKTVRRALKLAGCETDSDFKAYGLRKYPPAVRLKMIERKIYTTPKLGIVVIDGIRDLAALGINDEEQATDLATKLLKWTEEKQIHIMVVLHQNKNDTNARGHLGTELVNKAETVLSVTKDPTSKQLSVVEAQYCRDKEFEPFAFEIDGTGLPVLMGVPMVDTQSQKKTEFTPDEVPERTHLETLAEVFAIQPEYGYDALWRQVKQSLNKRSIKVANNRAKQIVTFYKDQRWITQPGGNKQPYQFSPP
jgi:hypothetical protein